MRKKNQKSTIYEESKIQSQDSRICTCSNFFRWLKIGTQCYDPAMTITLQNTLKSDNLICSSNSLNDKQ